MGCPDQFQKIYTNRTNHNASFCLRDLSLKKNNLSIPNSITTLQHNFKINNNIQSKSKINNIQKQIQNQQYGHSPKQSLTKNDIYQPGLFHQRRVDVALYNDIIIDKLGHLTSDEKTHYVTNALLEYHKPQQNHNRTKHIEYFNNPQCNEYHDFNVKPNNNNIDVLWIVTLFLILLLIDKVYTIWRNS